MTLFILGWLLFAVFSYFWFRRAIGSYTVGDRTLLIAVSLCFGPIIGFVALITWITNFDFWDKPAKW